MMNALKRRVIGLGYEHGDFVMLAILFISFRVMSVLFFRPGGYIRDYSDFILYLGAAAVTDEGHWPFVNFWLEYPPLFPWLFTGLYRISLLIPPWIEDPRLWFYTLLSLVLVVFEAGNFVLVYATALLLGDRYHALRKTVFYALLFVPVYVLSTDFDTLPLFFMLLGLYLLLRERDSGSGIALGIGFCLKITPLILLPVALRTLRTLRARIKHVIAAGLAIVVLSVPFLVLDAHLYLIPFRAALGRSSWETFWAALEGFFSYGAVGGDRFDRAVTDFTIHPGHLPWMWISVAFGLIYLFFYTRPADYRDKRKVLGLSLLTMTLFMLYSKGYSPQFLVYLLPLVVLYCPIPRGIAYALALSILNYLEQPIYFVMFPEQHGFFVGIVVFRALLLIALGVEGALALFPAKDRVAWLWNRILAALFIAFAAWGVCSAVILGRTYYDDHYRAETYRPAIAYLEEQAGTSHAPGILFTDPLAYRRVYPFLHDAVDLLVAQTSRPNWPAQLQEWVGAHPTFWLWRGEITDPDLEAWLDKNTELVDSQVFDWGTLFTLTAQK